MKYTNRNSDSTIRILLVEDNVDHARLMEIMLKKHHPKIEVLVARSGIECFRVLSEIDVNLIILDYELPMMSGLEILNEIRERKVNAPVIIVTGKGDENIAVKAMKQGVYDYIVKDKGYMYVLPRVVLQTLERYELEQRLIESEHRYQTLFNSIQDFISVQNHSLKINLANDMASKMSGKSANDLIAAQCYQVYFKRDQPCEDCPVLRTFEDHQIHFLEKTHNNEIYSIRSHPVFDRDGRLKNVMEIGQIITEQKALEKQIIQSEKLATIGLLSSGIAHELRNPLNIIETARYFIADTYGDTIEGLADKLEIIQKNVSRASTIINNLLEFSRQSDADKEIIDIPILIDKTISLIGKELISKNIELHKNYQNVPPAFFNLDSLKQVLLNIIINAIQAMPEGGELTVSTEMHDANSFNVHIRDTGNGISQEDMPHIFSPFFTTKDVGVGTGLGLYISHTIMQREGGGIHVDSTKGVGSTFTINLPTVKPTEARM